MRWPDRQYLPAETPSYLSILYFENLVSFENYHASPEYAALKRVMELEFPGAVSTIWNVEYELKKSFRK